MVVFIVFLLVISGIIVFSLAAGAVFFRQIFVRKTNDGSLDSSVIHSSLKQIEQAVNGIDLPGIKMAGTGIAASHLNDRKIMIPLLQAKLRWLHCNEKNSTSVLAGSGKNEELDSVCAADDATGVFYCRETLHITGSRNTRLTGYLCSVPVETGSRADWAAGQTQKAPITPYHDCTVILVHGYTDSAAGMAYLTEEYFKSPVFITDWPRDIKCFYMKQNDDGKTVAAVDYLVPGAGEMMGGSQREEDYDKLVAEMKRRDMNIDELYWYVNLRRYGTCKHAGFGMGFERMLMYLTGIDNIRDVLPFPRTPGNSNF